ncbi:MAG TPA: hypothetical protein VK098_06765 [Beutenbergiaceae bacterium]|nr:hypothetical protein [Beutenbergiaceae bacterium]
MATLPTWLEESLQCPVTGEKLTRETADGRPVYVARPDGGEPVQYAIDNGVPVLVPK